MPILNVTGIPPGAEYVLLLRVIFKNRRQVITRDCTGDSATFSQPFQVVDQLFQGGGVSIEL